MENEKVTWAFHRLGGMDQVTLRTAGELSRLRELDPKLWATLSCPASGLEFDTSTLALLDVDHDGRIRIPEVLDALDWTCARIADPSVLADRSPDLSLGSLRGDTPEGARMKSTAEAVLRNLGRTGGASINMDDVAAAASAADALLFNGDGVVPQHGDLSAAQSSFVGAALAVMGGTADASGAQGIDAAGVDAFLGALAAEKAWRADLASAPHPLGQDTEAAWAGIGALKDKLDDYFLRCRTASFAPQSAAALNFEENLVSPDEHGLLSVDALRALPLSHVAPDAALNLESGLNPAWRSEVMAFFRLVSPLLGGASELTEEGWIALQARIAPYGAALAARPVPGSSLPASDAMAALAKISDDELEALLSGSAAGELKAMMAEDLATPAASADIAELKKLVLFHQHLHRLLLNFVSFYDFYSLEHPGTFQAGTLFIDGRSCRLCLPVSDIAKHSAMASLSQLCLLYCECSRRVEGAPAAKMNIVAAMTAGSDAFLREGRNGVYVDNEGNDWDATLVKIVRNPISIKQAVWAPYLRISQLAAEQLAKFAGGKEAKLMASMTQKAESVAASPAKAAAAPFDISKSVGLFAAVGIALGAIGTAVGSIAGMLMSLHWWQFPLLIVAVFACVSGPSAFLAWLKLRKRTLGPILEASGWAVNGQLPVSLLLGSALTSEASLPGNSTRTRQDPLKQATPTGKITMAVIALLLAGAAYLAWTGDLAKFAKMAVTVDAPAAPAPAAAPADAKAQAPAAAPANAKAPAPAAAPAAK